MSRTDRETLLVGRETELGVVRAALARARRGGARLLVIEGEPGIGKSRLVRAVAEPAAKLGFDLRVGAAEELGWDRPFGPLLTALGIDAGVSAADERRQALVDLLHLETAGPPAMLAGALPEIRYRLVDGIAELVEVQAAACPTLLVVENLHWADRSTFLTIAAVLRRAVGLPLVVLATTRPPASPALRGQLDSLCDDDALRIPLGPLPDDAVLTLARELVKGEPSPTLLALVAGAGGNPLLVIELLRGLSEDGSLRVVDGVADAPSDRLPDTFHRRVLRRLGALEEDARGVLRLGAMLGSSFTVDELEVVSGRSAVDLMAQVEAAVRAGMLEEAGERLAFRHELVRVVVYDQVPAGVRRRVHRDVARSLMAAGGPELRIASHFALGAEPGDRDAVTSMHRSARRLLPTAPEMALQLLERAAELAPPHDDLVAGLIPDRIEALVFSGRLEDADALSAEVDAVAPDDPRHMEVLHRRGVLLLLRNRSADAAALLEAVSAVAVGATRSDVLAEAALAHLSAGDLDATRRAAEQARELGRGAGGPVGETLALCVLSRLAAHDLALDESLRLANEAVSVAEADTTGLAQRHQPMFFCGLALHDLDRLDELDELVSRARGLGDEHGAAFAGPLYHGLAAFTALRAGRLEDAATEAASGVRACQETGLSLAAGWCHALVALAALHQDDIDTANQAVLDAERISQNQPPLLGMDLVVLAHALVEEELGDRKGAVDRLRGAWDLFAVLDIPLLSSVLGPDLVRLAVETGEAKLARDVAATMEVLAKRVPLPSWRGAAAEAVGLAMGDVDALLEAVDAYRESPRVLALAQACEDAGRVLSERGEGAKGLDLLQEAIQCFDAIGARRDASRAAATMRAHGGRPRRSRRPQSGTWESLSRSERDVARLVAEGLGNTEVATRLYVSRRTVETHLHRIFAKLGMRSRVELALWVSEREP